MLYFFFILYIIYIICCIIYVILYILCCIIYFILYILYLLYIYMCAMFKLDGINGLGCHGNLNFKSKHWWWRDDPLENKPAFNHGTWFNIQRHPVHHLDASARCISIWSWDPLQQIAKPVVRIQTWRFHGGFLKWGTIWLWLTVRHGKSTHFEER